MQDKSVCSGHFSDPELQITIRKEVIEENVVIAIEKDW